MSNLINFVDDLQRMAVAQPEVNAFGEGNIYDLLNSGGQIEKYAAVIITLQSVNIVDDNYSINCTIFYVDRLTKNPLNSENNRLEIQDTAVDTLHNILLQLGEEYEIENENYTLFTQKFADNCAGAYTNLKITLPISGCFEQY